MRRSLHCQCQFIRSRIIGSRWTDFCEITYLPDLCEITYLPDLCEITYLPDKCEIFACKHKVVIFTHMGKDVRVIFKELASLAGQVAALMARCLSKVHTACPADARFCKHPVALIFDLRLIE